MPETRIAPSQAKQQAGAPLPAETGGVVTLRSVLLALALMPINVLWVVQVELVWYSGHPTCASLYYNVIFSLLLVLLANVLVRRVRPKWSLRQSELLVVFTMLSLGSSMAGHDTLQILLPALGHAAWFATPENRWSELILPLLPKDLTVSDFDALEDFYYGHSSLYVPRNFLPWLVPIAWWSSFLIVLVFVMLCLNSLFRRDWMDHERLTFPIVELPFAMTRQDGPSFFKNRLLWGGILLAGGMDLMNGLNFLMPTLPSVHLKMTDLGPSFTSPPWNALGWLPISFYPFIIGLGYFLPADLAFSSWFFYLFRKAQSVLVAALGYEQTGGLPYFTQQSNGAFIALFLLMLWRSRDMLSRAFGAVVSGARQEYRGELMAPRTAALGVLLGMTYLVWFSMKAGMTPWVAVAYMLIYIALSVMITRMRAELGPPAHEVLGIGANVTLLTLVGASHLTPGTLAAFSLFNFLNRSHRGHTMPQQLEGLKLAQRSGTPIRSMLVPLLLASAAGIALGWWALLHSFYAEGAATRAGFGWDAMNLLQSRLSTSYSGTDRAATGFMTGAFLFTALLAFCRQQFLWWPFHPIGYALAMAFGLDYYWMCLVISWAVKVLVLRYGGLGLFRQLSPFFLGLVVGEFFVGSAWSIISVILQAPMYTFWIF